HHRDGDDAHDAARGGADIVGGARRKGEGEEGEEQREEAGHAGHTSRPNFERKHRDAVRIALWHSFPNSRERMFSMTYLIEGLGPDRFAPLFALDDADLAAINARRVTATADRGFPRRISLEDAKVGE